MKCSNFIHLHVSVLFASEKVMASHSSTLAWKIPWTEEPGRLQSMGSWRVGHDWATSLSLFTFMHWRRKWQPLECSCLENPRDGGAWLAAIYGVTQSQTWLKLLSSSNTVFQQHLLKRLPFLHRIFLLPLSKIRCLCVCGFISGPSVLFHLSNFLFLFKYHTVLMTVYL